MENIEALKAEAANVDAEITAAQTPPPVSSPENASQASPSSPPTLTPEQEAQGLIEFAVGMFKPLYPSIGIVYTEDVCRKLATVAAPLMAKYNFSIGAFFDKWKEEVNFALVALPVATQTIKAIRDDNNARIQTALDASIPENLKSETPASS